MIKKFMQTPKPGQIIALVVFLGLLTFFLKDAGITTVLIVIATAVIAGLILLPWSNVTAYDKEDIIDWEIISRHSDQDD
jgi:hypothetical protein